MKLQFDKNRCRYLQSVIREVRRQEQTQEIRLPEGLPDVGTILSAWGQIILCSKEWHSDGMEVSAGIMVWVLYIPEDESAPECAESWIPFHARWEFPQTDAEGVMRVKCALRNLDARVTSARKIMVRAETEICGQALTAQETEVFSPGELPEGVEILKKCYPVMMPSEAGEKQFSTEDSLAIPASCPEIEKILRYDLQPELAEWKIMGSRLVFRGAARLHILYRSTDGEIQCWDFEVPFSQYTDLEKAYDQETGADLNLELTGLELEKEGSSLELKSSIVCQYMIYERKDLELVEDAYCLDRELDLQTIQLELPQVLEDTQSTMQAQKIMNVDGNRIVDVVFQPGITGQNHTLNGITLEQTGRFCALYYDHQGKLCSAESDWSESEEIPMDENCCMNPESTADGRPQVSFAGGNLQIKNDVTVKKHTFAICDIAVVMGLELGDVRKKPADRPSLILCRAGEESLWDIAKKAGSTVRAIRQANHLQQEPEQGQILLVPIG